MKPFFSYYGAKYTVAKYIGPPRYDFVIEPFCGSAAYATRYSPRKARLYDINPDICDLWDWLINCSESDVKAIPDKFDSFEEIGRLSHGASLFVRFWVAVGRAEPTKTISPWYYKYRDYRDCRVWGPAVKARIIKQKPVIKLWRVDNLSYQEIPVCEAHWHIDPPYSNYAGSRYPFSEIDYNHLADWVQTLPGIVDVCENYGATWLPFQSLCNVETTRGKRSGTVSQEVMVRLDNRPNAKPSLESLNFCVNVKV